MECKLLMTLKALEKQISELIDTLWNVNPIPNGAFPPETLELIDTLWNVN